MKFVWILVALIPLLVELSSATPYTYIDPYGRDERNSRMSKVNSLGQLEDEDDDVEEEDDDEDDDEQDDDIYPPDFSKLFPNPDARPVGPEGGNERPQSQYGGNHPTSPQQGRPVHGPASLQGPAALRGPIQAQHGQRQGGIGGPGGQGGPGGPPPQQYRRGPPPSGPPRRGPPPQYRDDLNLVEEEDEETIPEGRQLMSYGPRQRVVSYPTRPTYPTRRVAVYPQRRVVSYPMYQNRVSYARYPFYNYNQRPVMSYRPSYTTPVRRYRTHVESSLEEGPVVIPRSYGARIYRPWSHNPLRADTYNPQFIVNPTEMLSRRRFRYHPSQIIQRRIPVNTGVWGNPRNTWTQAGGHYGQPHWV